MQEVGATKMVGGEAPAAAPPAPADVAAIPADAEKSGTGLAWRVLKPGTGTQKPGPTTVVSVHYTGWTTDGKSFDSSISRGKPAQFPLNRVIPGWTEGLQLMVVGEERRFWIPVELAYNGKPGKPAGMLVFDVELIEVRD
ncbi:MAG: FKBP-type peptidyl-prolyl cis-trans isomerase [Polyangiaceae bacterium]|nr:FKBP-type peptidyl-prolyl cis-trans isomerase [Polyangiaceae bacterium]